MSNYKPVFIFAGGGTGGHLFPAIAVAEAIKEKLENADIHFIGRSDKLESSVVPKHGFAFHAISVEGFSRKNMMVNIRALFKFVVGFFSCLFLMMKLKPVAAITTGAYISAPVIAAARVMGAKVFMIEPNSYPGMVTRLFDSSVEETYIAFEETKKYLRKDAKTYLSGNPIRKSFVVADKAASKEKLGFNADQPLVFITGGSLGAAKINAAAVSMLETFQNYGIQCLLQTGKNYFESYRKHHTQTCQIVPFVEDMSAALNAADVMVARAGATTIAEILGTGMAAVLIPSPNVAENHQYFNAKSLADNGAALLIEEKEIDAKLLSALVELCGNSQAAESLRKHAKAMHKERVAEVIADRILIISLQG